MAKYEIPGAGVYDFPDDATPDEINEFAQDVAETKKAQEYGGIGDYAARQAALIARGVGTSPAAVGAGAGAMLAAPTGVGVPVGAAAGAIAGTALDVVPRVYNAIAEMAGSERRLPPLGDVLKRMASEAGLPKPASEVELIQQQAIESAAAAMTPLGAGQMMARAASPVVRGVGEALAAQPYIQTGLAGISGALSEYAKQEGAGEIGQTAAALAPSLIPAAGGLIQKGARTAAAMGAPAAEVAENIRPFSEMGVPVSYGQALQREGPQYFERAIEKFPLAPAQYRKFAEQQAEAIGGKVEQMRKGLSTVTEPTEAGRAIQRGVEAPSGVMQLPGGGAIAGTIGGLTERAKVTNQRLYNKVFNLIPQQKQLKADNTTNVLNSILEKVPGTEIISQSAISKKPRIIDFRQKFLMQLEKDNGFTNIQALKKIRTDIGKDMENVSWGDKPKDFTEIKAIYQALTDDIKQAAIDEGRSALNAYNRANKYNVAYNERIARLQSTINKKNPEQAYLDAFSESKAGGTKIRAILQSIPKDDQKEVVSAFVARMGRAPASQQDEYGQVFDIGKFANNYRALNPKAQQALFSRFGSQFKSDMDKITKVAIEISRARGILANPSGTAASVAPVATATAAGGALAAGKFSFATGILGTVAAGSGLSRLFTNQKFVNWLAKNIDIPGENYAASAGALEAIAKEDDDDEMLEIARMVRNNAIRQEIGK
ncbi:MAG: hypothetical protein EBZ61_08925 [Micrococcales bacterium]|nr:hypothetical protein [Micrococcales bacterium]